MNLQNLQVVVHFLIYWKLLFSLSFFIYDTLFVIYDRFSNISRKFQIFVLTFLANVVVGDF